MPWIQKEKTETEKCKKLQKAQSIVKSLNTVEVFESVRVKRFEVLYLYLPLR